MATTILHTSSAKPRVRSGVEVGAPAISRLGTSIEIDPPEALTLARKVLTRANGKLTITELAGELGADESDVLELCRQLHESGYVWLEPPEDELPIKVFRDEFRMWVESWIPYMYQDPVWNELYEGSASPAVIAGWAVENIHYTRSTAEHMTLAALRAETPLHLKTSLKHFSEEWDHYQLFKRGCQSIGMPGEDLDRAVPLATTRAITSYMKSLTASKEHLVYRSCEALLEATASDKNNVLAYYDRLQENYGFAPEFIGALKEHIDVDQDFGHDEIFDELLSEYTSVPSDLVAEILQSCRTLADLFVLWNREVASYYGSVDKPAVRTEYETLAVPAGARDHHPALWIEWSAHHGKRAVFAGRSAQVTEGADMAGLAERLGAGESETYAASTVCASEQAFQVLEAARTSCARWFDADFLANELGATWTPEFARRFVVELSHLMSGIAIRPMTIAIAECNDIELRETLIKLSIHWQRNQETWDQLVQQLAGAKLAELAPLASTSIVLLALEELAAKDTLAFSFVATSFGVPGHEEASKRLVGLVTQATHGNAKVQQIIEDWARNVDSGASSYATIAGLEDNGFPFVGHYGQRACELLAPHLMKNLKQSCIRMKAVNDSFKVFVSGISLFHDQLHQEWPRKRTDLLNRDGRFTATELSK